MWSDQNPGTVPHHLLPQHEAEHGHSLRIPEHVRRPQDTHQAKHVAAGRLLGQGGHAIQLLQHIVVATVFTRTPGTQCLLIADSDPTVLRIRIDSITVPDHRDVDSDPTVLLIRIMLMRVRIRGLRFRIQQLLGPKIKTFAFFGSLVELVCI